jgi:hypothetical protein
MSEPKSIEDKLQIIKARNHGRDSIKDAIVTKQVEAMKYYTPEIEEFHIGFEYEIMDLALNMVDKEFRSDVITHGGDIDNALEWIKTNEVRVKHLSREDIESLGWEIERVQGLSFSAVKKFEYSVPDNTGSTVEGSWTISSSSDRYCVISKDCMGVSTFFRGTINNKSELKRILKQLGI